MERQNFEDSWKRAFDKAEVAPSENVWTNIELDLARANGSKLKRKLVIFQLLAAASLLFVMGVGVGVYVMKNSYDESARELASLKLQNEKLIADAENQAVQRSPAPNAAANPNLNITSPNGKTSAKILDTENLAQQAKSSSLALETSENGKKLRGGSTISENPIAVVGDKAVIDDNKMLAFANPAYVPAIVEQREVKLKLVQEEQVVDPVQLMLAKLDQREREMQQETEKKDKRAIQSEKLWTSVGFAAGSFSSSNAGVSNSRGTQPLALAQNSSIANQEAKASGTSYSVGANVGTKLSKRWVFQGGVNYLTQSSDYTTQSAVVASDDFMSFRPASINELDKISASDAPPEEKLVTTAPYNVNNNLRYLSVPMQAGYMLINKNFGWQLNAGVATDVFLQNTVSAEGGGLDKTSQSIGEHSPYRSVNLSGLAGTELSYRFSKNYRIALNPGVRYPFNSIYRSELAVKANPITFDIGLRFRYIFH